MKLFFDGGKLHEEIDFIVTKRGLKGVKDKID